MVSTAIPQGIRPTTFGFSTSSTDRETTFGATATTTDLTDAFNSYILGSPTASSLLANLGPYAVAIGGRTFPVDTSFEPYRREAFRHRTLQAQRQSINFTNIMGEGTVNTEGLWRREQVDWSMGAGQQYLDRKQDSFPNRFYSSKGLDVFTAPYEAQLLNATKQVRASTNTNLFVKRCANYTYIVDGNTVYECANIEAATPTFTAMTFSTSGSYSTPSVINSIDSNNSYVFVATDTGIFYYQCGTTGANAQKFYGFAKPDSNSSYTGYQFVRWCNEQVVAASGNYLYMFQSNHITSPYPSTGSAPGILGNDTLMIHPALNWWWSDACSGSSAAYFAGYSKTSAGNYNGCVYRSSLTITSSSSQVNYPVQALPMSPDEYPTCLKNYLNFIMVGTNRGIRMCQTLNAYDPSATASGDLKAGPLEPNLLQPVTYPVRAIVGDGRFVYFGWSNYDSQSTGLGIQDLTTFIGGDPLGPAYSSGHMVSGSGEIVSMTWNPITNVPLFAVAGKGFYTVDKTKYVASGTLTTGGFTYGIPDHKIPVYFDYGVDMPDNTPAAATFPASVSATLQTEPFDPSQTQTLAIPPATEGFSEQQVTGGPAYNSEMFQVNVTLNSDSTQATTPTLFRWTLKSWPTTVAETEIMVPLQLFSVNNVEGFEAYTDPYDALAYLNTLYWNQTITTYQEGPLTANVVVAMIDWIPHKRRGNYDNGFEGDCVVTMKTIGGYNTYTPVPTS